MPLPYPTTHAVSEIGHAVEHRMDLWNDILAIHEDRLPLRRAQRHVQHSPILGKVNPVTAEHGIDAVA
jgi:hypothetical protein